MTIDRGRLLKSAKSYADRSLRAYADDDHEAALTDAAVSLEHLSKAVLCDLDPALLIELKNGPLDSLLHLVGHGDKAKKPAKDIRIISGAGAITRVKEVLPHIKVPQERINQLIALRNGALHATFFGVGETQLILAAYIRLSNHLFEELKVGEADRWGDHRVLVDALVSETLSELEKSVRARMVKAKRDHDAFIEKVPEEQREDLLSALQLVAATTFVRSSPGGWEWDYHPCPACSHERGAFLGKMDEVHSIDALSPGVLRAVTLPPKFFVCGVCGLRLCDEDELTAAGLRNVILISEEEIPNGDSIDAHEYIDFPEYTDNDDLV